MKHYIEDVAGIWSALDSGKKVYWVHEGYMVHPVESNGSKYAMRSERGNQALRVTCISNYFGSYLDPKDLGSIFYID